MSDSKSRTNSHCRRTYSSYVYRRSVWCQQWFRPFVVRYVHNVSERLFDWYLGSEDQNLTSVHMNVNGCLIPIRLFSATKHLNSIDGLMSTHFLSTNSYSTLGLSSLASEQCLNGCVKSCTTRSELFSSRYMSWEVWQRVPEALIHLESSQELQLSFGNTCP